MTESKSSQPVYSPGLPQSYFADLHLSDWYKSGAVDASANARLETYDEQRTAELSDTEKLLMIDLPAQQNPSNSELYQHVIRQIAPRYLYEGFAASGYTGRTVQALATKHYVAQSSKYSVETITWKDLPDAQTQISETVHPALINVATHKIRVPIGTIERGIRNWIDTDIFNRLSELYADELAQHILGTKNRDLSGLLGAYGEMYYRVNSFPSQTDLCKLIDCLAVAIHGDTKRFPDAVIVSPRRWQWFMGLGSSLKGQRSRLVVPLSQREAQHYMNKPDDPRPVGLIGNLRIPVFVESNMPTDLDLEASTESKQTLKQGKEDWIVVACRQDMHLYVPLYAEIICDSSFSETDPTSVKYSMQGRAYFTAETRKGAVGVIGGAGMSMGMG